MRRESFAVLRYETGENAERLETGERMAAGRVRVGYARDKCGIRVTVNGKYIGKTGNKTILRFPFLTLFDFRTIMLT